MADNEVYREWRDLDTDTIEEIACRAYSACKIACRLGGSPVAPSRTALPFARWIMEPAKDPGE